MYKDSNCTVKPETLKKILRYIAFSKNPTRRSIAENCGISVMTAGKAVEFFLDEGLLIERRAPKTSAGAPPMCVNLDPKYNCTVIDLYRRNYSATVLDINGKVLFHLDYKYNHNIFIDDNFRRFISQVEESTRYLHPEYSIGTGILLPDDYIIKPTFTASQDVRDRYISSVRKIIGKRLTTHRFVSKSKESLALEYFSSISEHQDSANIIYICLNNDGVLSAVSVNGREIRGKSGSGFDISKMFYSDKMNIDFLLRSSRSPDEYCEHVAFAVANVISCYDPHLIVIDSETTKYPDGLCQLIIESLKSKYGFSEEKLPRFVTYKPGSSSFFALGMLVRFKKMFLEDTFVKMFSEE